MSRLSRRAFLEAAAVGATFVWAGAAAGASRQAWIERRDLFAEGVASGDPDFESVLLWTRYSGAGAAREHTLILEVAEDAGFERVVATHRTRVLADADYTCRVLVGGLKPAQTYWYRFTDAAGRGSRIGRTRTAPARDDLRAAKFAFVSCQNICEGAQNAYRRMIFEDERRAPGEQLDFVLHLGDFVYEVVDYPEDRPGGRRYDRRLRDVIRYPDGEKVGTFHIPRSLADYRTLYRAYLQDPDLQDARARWPFVPVWDNHEFSWMGWQSLQRLPGVERPAQTLKVAANQAWFEYQPARVRSARTASLERFEAPEVRDAPIQAFDAHGLGAEPNNRLAIDSLIVYRTLRWGRHLDLVITDQHSYRSEEPTSRREAQALVSDDFPELWPEDALRVLDGGRSYADARPPNVIRHGSTEIQNFRRDAPPQTILGASQRDWFLEQLRTSRATWKVWGSSSGGLDLRADPQNLPQGTGKSWPGGYASFGGGGDYATAYAERAAIYKTVREAGVTGFAVVSGDRHSFWAGLAADALPPAHFDPVGVAFITGSISAPGIVEAYEHRFPKDHALRALYVAEVGGRAQPTINLLLRHGVRACLEYQRSGEAAKARAASNPELSPHLSFVDMGGHGYATVSVGADAIDCEFVCIPRPLERSGTPDGGPIRYRVSHRAALWREGERPRLEQRVLEGDPGLSI